MPNRLSVAIVTLNEAVNLRRTLESVRRISEPPPEIVVLDSGSTDETVEIVEKAGARLLEEPWKGFARQKNSAIAQAGGDWLLSLDADEEVSPELAGEIRALLATEPAFSAYRIPRLNHFMGRALRHGGYWPDPKIRLFRRGTAWFEERPVHETVKDNGLAGALTGHLIHHCYPTLEEYIEHMNRYSSASAGMLVTAGWGSLGWPAFLWNAFLNPAATFAYNYFFRLGFLDGREGLLQHVNHSFYIHWKFAKAWEAARRRKDGTVSKSMATAAGDKDDHAE